MKADGKTFEAVPDKKNGGQILREHGLLDGGPNRKVTTAGAVRAEVKA